MMAHDVQVVVEEEDHNHPEDSNMDIKIIEDSPISIQFATKITLPMANTLRRIMITEVPSMAIEDVVFIENSSPMYDEVLAHRLGLVPLKTDLKNYVLPEECSCQSELGCANCRVVLTLDVESKESIRTVYSGDLISEDPAIDLISKKIPLTKLAPGQKVRLEAYARLGLGKEHAKWQPVSVSAYKNMSHLTIDRSLCNLCGDCVVNCVKKIFSINHNNLKIINQKDCILCMECENLCPVSDSNGNKAIKVQETNVLLFKIESTGALSSKDIFLEAINILIKKTEEFLNELASLAVTIK